MKALIGLACSALLASTTAMAADSYMSAGIGFTKYDESGINTAGAAYTTKADLIAGSLTYGHRYSDNFAAEAMFITGLQKGDLKVNGASTTAKAELDNSIAAYAVVSSGFSDDFSVFAKAGVSKVEGSISVVVSGVTYAVSADNTDFSYGAGAQMKINDESRIKGEYLSLWSDKGVQWNGSGNWEADYSVILISYEWDL